jgi:hypothetical protein
MARFDRLEAAMSLSNGAGFVLIEDADNDWVRVPLGAERTIDSLRAAIALQLNIDDASRIVRIESATHHDTIKSDEHVALVRCGEQLSITVISGQ